MNNQTKGVLLAATTALLWGMLAIGLKVSLNYFDSYTVVWFRFFIATVSLISIFSIKKPSFLNVLKKPPRLMLLAGLFLGFNYIGYMQGIKLAGPAATQIIIQTGPIVLGLVGFIIFKEKINLIRGIGFLIAALGFSVFYFYQISEFGTEKTEFTKGVAWILFGALSWVSYAVTNKKLVTQWHPQQVNLIVFALPVILFLPMADFSALTSNHEWWIWLLMIALGINTVVAYGTLAASFKYAEANRISIVITLNPIITFIFLEIMMTMNVQWFEIKPVPTMAFAGAALVLLGAILAVGIKRR
ncbi:DMT family transporter [Carboxylicivirga caseinilyticus]|uniref:DMT family transporter n=1 Tax=Carboxylicivirga caseinilyticus TaxID=3417572 RepID=UPI003D328C4B|nr:DMT family transporter [Marinilabiliaceae bacterium A049]